VAGGPAWRQPPFYPFAAAARLARGMALQLPGQAPEMETRRFGPVPAVVSAGTWDEESRSLSVFLVNRDPDRDHVAEIDVRALALKEVAEQQTLFDSDFRATNTADRPDRVRPRGDITARLDGGRLTVPLPAVSWTALSLTTGQPS
jgi:alpha-N-arabinofuranosidase